MLPPITIEKADHHRAQNGPVGVSITTGTRYFAAVLLQEVYEAKRYMAWYWGGALAIAGFSAIVHLATGLDGQTTGITGFAVAAMWMILVGKHVFPFNSWKRELMGQAIEIAAIRWLYERPDMESEYRLQARSMIRSDGVYAGLGYWPDMRVDPMQYTNDDAIAGTPNDAIEKMVALLKDKQPEAADYVWANMALLKKWRPLGDESKGY